MKETENARTQHQGGNANGTSSLKSDVGDFFDECNSPTAKPRPICLLVPDDAHSQEHLIQLLTEMSDCLLRSMRGKPIGLETGEKEPPS